MADTRRTWQGIAVYLFLTFLLSSVFYYLVISAGTLHAANGRYVLGLMWSPGLAALLTRLLFQRNLRGQGWGWGGTRYQLASYAIPLAYAAVVYLPVWLLGLGGFSAAHAARIAAQLGRPDLSPALAVGLLFVAAGTLGMAQSSLSALGEELGWRGYLVPELAKVTSFTRVGLISGAVWVVWHYPVLLFADYHGGGPAWYSLACFTVMVMGIGFLFAWMRLKSGSLWTGMLLHASHNLWVQGVFDPSTTDTGPTEYLIGEFGAGLALVGALAGLLCWRKRKELPTS